MSTSDPEGAAGKVAYADVQDVIEAAARFKNEATEHLSVEELQEIAGELDIPAELVTPAIEEVRRRRELALAAERLAAARARVRTRALQIAVGLAAVVLVVSGTSSHVALRDASLAAQRQRSQVVNVLERHLATQSQWEGAADSTDKHAELSGAENRVRVERARYDELVTEYRQEAGSLVGRMVVALMGHPETLPLSSELQRW